MENAATLAPPHPHFKPGHDGKRAPWILPRLDLVASWNDTNVKSPQQENAALHALIAQ